MVRQRDFVGDVNSVEGWKIIMCLISFEYGYVTCSYSLLRSVYIGVYLST